ncbi:MAG TPA: hypothetical protein VIL20_17545 [Sandaracinaceae bacterium]
MSAIELRSLRTVARAVALLVLAASGCRSGPEPPSPELIADVRTLRALIGSDPALGPLAEVERVAHDRPVLAGQRLEAEALPAARRQVERVREARTSTSEGRSLARRLARAYERRVEGLERWREYLEDAATDDAVLLESLTARREAEVAVLELDQEMDRYEPVAEPRRPASAERTRAGEGPGTAPD